MIINVGSKNQTKIQAVKKAIRLYPNIFTEPQIIGVDVQVELFGHPKSLKETVNGAMERAKNAFADCSCSYSFGIEGGLMEVPFSKTGFMEVSVCAIYDGKNIYLGLSPAFEWPTKVTELILNNKSDASQAFQQLGLTHHQKLGAIEGGAIGLLTSGRITREDQIEKSIITALISLDKPEYFK